MIGKIYRIRFCCDNPIGETWYHNMWKLFTPLEEIYMLDKVHGGAYAIEVDRGYIGGYIRGSAIALVHGQVEHRRRCFRVEIWQMLS